MVLPNTFSLLSEVEDAEVFRRGWPGSAMADAFRRWAEWWEHSGNSEPTLVSADRSSNDLCDSSSEDLCGSSSNDLLVDEHSFVLVLSDLFVGDFWFGIGICIFGSAGFATDSFIG